MLEALIIGDGRQRVLEQPQESLTLLLPRRLNAVRSPCAQGSGQQPTWTDGEGGAPEDSMALLHVMTPRIERERNCPAAQPSQGCRILPRTAVNARSDGALPRVKGDCRVPHPHASTAPCQQLLSTGRPLEDMLSPGQEGRAQQRMTDAQHRAPSHLLGTARARHEHRPRHESGRQEPFRPATDSPLKLCVVVLLLLAPFGADNVVPSVKR